MLEGLERKLVAVVADAMAALDHLDVVQHAGPGDEPAAGRVTLRLAVDSISPESGFERDVIALSGPTDAPQSRRVLPLRFVAIAHLTARPASASAADRTAARTLLLGDLSAVAHALAAPTFLAGTVFDVAGDPGFDISAFHLAGGDLVPSPAEGADPSLLEATLQWDGRCTVWPTTPPGPEGVVLGIDVELVPVPLRLSALEPVVRQGASTIVTIDGVAGRRLTSLDPPADEPIAIAVSVTSDLPPADRGRIDGGTAGTPEGVRIVPITAGVTTVTYSAPTASLGATTVEFVAVHLATREGERGAYLDALPIRLVPAP